MITIISFLEKNDHFWKRTTRFELSKNEERSFKKNESEFYDKNLNFFQEDKVIYLVLNDFFI